MRNTKRFETRLTAISRPAKNKDKDLFSGYKINLYFHKSLFSEYKITEFAKFTKNKDFMRKSGYFCPDAADDELRMRSMRRVNDWLRRRNR